MIRRAASTTGANSRTGVYCQLSAVYLLPVYGTAVASAFCRLTSIYPERRGRYSCRMGTGNDPYADYRRRRCGWGPVEVTILTHPICRVDSTSRPALVLIQRTPTKDANPHHPDNNESDEAGGDDTGKFADAPCLIASAPSQVKCLSL